MFSYSFNLPVKLLVLIIPPKAPKEELVLVVGA